MENQMKGTTGLFFTKVKKSAGKLGFRLAILAVASVLLVACNVSALDGPLGQQPDTSSSQLEASQTAGMSTNPAGGGSSAADIDAIKGVIEMGNQEEIQAFAANDPSVMADTSTSDYYQQMVQSYNDMANAGVTALHLDKLTWGAITFEGVNTAQANTTETWTATLSDGSTQQETDANIYTLVVENGTWKVQDDQHPNTRTLQPQPQQPQQPQPSDPGALPSPTIAPVSPEAPSTTAPSSGTTAPAAVASAIKSVVEKGNQEEIQAFATDDPSVMADTSTSDYYQQIAQSYNDMANAGVAALNLDKLVWGSITLQDASTAQANTTETWTTTFSDGSTQQETDANVYTLVLQNGAWKVQDDQHPNTRTLQPQPQQPQLPQPGNSGAAPTPIAPSATGTDQSSNWAGYAATGGTFTSVSGSWVVPSVSGGSGNSISSDATWVGIGGAGSTDLIQAGTQAEVQNGQVVYSAWWETLPQSSRTAALDVAAGDSVTVSITETSNNNWQIVIRDTTTGQSFQKTLTYRSSHSSAEWIEEAPSMGARTLIPLDNFGTVTFTNGRTVEDGRQVNIEQAGGQPITMYSSAGRGRYGRSGGQGGQALARPSALAADGASFSVTRTSVAAPSTMP